jgi:hypothetical protein
LRETRSHGRDAAGKKTEGAERSSKSIRIDGQGGQGEGERQALERTLAPSRMCCRVGAPSLMGCAVTPAAGRRRQELRAAVQRGYRAGPPA